VLCLQQPRHTQKNSEIPRKPARIAPRTAGIVINNEDVGILRAQMSRRHQVAGGTAKQEENPLWTVHLSISKHQPSSKQWGSLYSRNVITQTIRQHNSAYKYRLYATDRFPDSSGSFGEWAPSLVALWKMMIKRRSQSVMLKVSVVVLAQDRIANQFRS